MNRLCRTAGILGGLCWTVVAAWAAQSQPLQEVRVRVSLGEFAPGGMTLLTVRPNIGLVTILEQRPVEGSFPRERNPELAEDRIVVTGVDNRGGERIRVVLPDPRLLRAETVDESGQLHKQTLYRADVDFAVAIPDDPAIVSLMLFQPLWTGAEFILVPLGEARLR